MDSVSINLQTKSKIIGNIMFEQVAGLQDVLEYLSQLVDNYNRYLIGKKMEDPIYAHRFFDLERDKNLHYALHRHIRDDSYKYVKENFPDVSWPDDEEQCILGYIALTKLEIDFNNAETKHQVVINLDERTICLSTLFYLQELSEYRKEHGLNDDEEPKILFLDYNPRIIYFNQLNEMLSNIDSYDAFQTNSIKKYESIYVSI